MTPFPFRFRVHTVALSVFVAPVLIGASGTARAAQALEPPAGYALTTAASSPLVGTPLLGCFDDRGRLFVAEDRRGDAGDGGGVTRIRLLEDANGDGIFDRSTVFADSLSFCQGLLWHDRALYVTTTPSVWRLEDTDRDGRVDSRREIVTNLGSPDDVASVRGPVAHPDGRLYWFLAPRATDERSRDTGIADALLWSCRPDGGDARSYLGTVTGIPTDAAVSDEGEIFGSVRMWQRSPRADGIVHWSPGSTVARSSTASPRVRTSAAPPPLAQFFRATPVGITVERTAAPGARWATTLYYAETDNRRIMRLALERSGSSYTGNPEVFASTTDSSVHFTDMLQDADGSLLVINAGALYGNRAAPADDQSQARGAIYRIRKVGMTVPADSRGTAVDWHGLDAPALIALLGDARPVVRDRAIEALARRGDAVVPALHAALQHDNAFVSSNAVWTMSRIGSPAALAAVRDALMILEARVRLAACHSVLITGDRDAAERLVGKLVDDHLGVQRMAAHALARLGERRAVTALGGSAGVWRDEKLSRALVDALIDIDDPAQTRRLLDSREPCARKAAEYVLAGHASGRLRGEPAAATGPSIDISRREILQQTDAWFASDKARALADNIVAQQSSHGGWSNWANEEGMTRAARAEEASAIEVASLDDGATTTQLKILARVLTAPGLPSENADRYRTSFLRGFDYLLKAQYENGGWPHRYPAKGYHAHITFNDNTTYNVIALLRSIVAREPAYAWIDADRRQLAATAIEKGIDCILACQVVVDGRKTAWGAQHDAKTLAPAPARAFEPASLCGSESVGVVRLLMTVERPSPAVIAAVQAAIAWFEQVKITGLRVERFRTPEGFDVRVVTDPAAPALWARYYELGTNRPIFCGRDSVIKYSLAEIERERRAGYGWYTEGPGTLLERDYPRWAARWVKP